jgi:hypothetical protein
MPKKYASFFEKHFLRLRGKRMREIKDNGAIIGWVGIFVLLKKLSIVANSFGIIELLELLQNLL